MNIFKVFENDIRKLLDELAAEGQIPAGLDTARLTVEPPREAAHGDLSTNAAMILAKPAGKPPRALAELLVAKLKTRPDVASAEIAGPGLREPAPDGRRLARPHPRRADRRHRLWREHAGWQASGERRIRVGQPHRPAARGPRPRRRVRRRAGRAAGEGRLRRRP
ncbi:protein of unknown function (plasmid) [Azospirillum baldaniorum]|uniref:Arginyl tRNA synthetase N-terminal domain-containing protein n=1 Tax=Azospirillum baldaniorum TaxID=1064539 RepID=A0A9P1JU22_9PROT|nr:protein of unknown function [Azospirillum baldaniorum]